MLVLLTWLLSVYIRFLWIGPDFPSDWGRKQSLCEAVTWECSPSDSFISSLKPGVNGCLCFSLHLKNSLLHYSRSCLLLPRPQGATFMPCQVNRGQISVFGHREPNSLFHDPKKIPLPCREMHRGKKDWENGKSAEESKQNCSDGGMEKLETTFWHFPGLYSVRKYTEATDMHLIFPRW